MACKFNLLDVIPLNLDRKILNKDRAVSQVVYVYAVNKVPNKKQPGFRRPSRVPAVDPVSWLCTQNDSTNSNH